MQPQFWSEPLVLWSNTTEVTHGASQLAMARSSNPGPQQKLPLCRLEIVKKLKVVFTPDGWMWSMEGSSSRNSQLCGVWWISRRPEAVVVT